MVEKQHTSSSIQTGEGFYSVVDNLNLSPHISYIDFARKAAHLSPNSETTLLGYLHHIKEKHQDGGVNMINYVATLIQGMDPQVLGGETYLRDENDRIRINARKEALENFSSVIVEQPLAEVSKKEIRKYSWQKKENGEMTLSSTFGNMDDILEESLKSSQPADFEHERYQANYENYKKLKKARQKGDKRPFVEYSPSPRLTAEAKKRGYFGMDTIFIYRFDEETQEEHIEQRWLKASPLEFTKLVNELDHEENLYLSDGAVMRKSRLFESHELTAIEEFINRNNGQFKEQPELVSYVETELRSKVEKMAAPVLERAAQKAILGLPPDEEMSVLESTGALLQHLLRDKIKNLLGVDKTRIKISDLDLKRMEEDEGFRALYVQQNKNKMPLAGCGGSNESDSNGITRSMADIFKTQDKYGSLEFSCPVCGSTHKRQMGKLMTHCPETGGEIPKC